MILKLFWAHFGSHAQFWCAHSLSSPPKSFPESVFFFSSSLFLHLKRNQQKKMTFCFKYIYICIQVQLHFHSGQRWTSTAKPSGYLSLKMSIRIKYHTEKRVDLFIHTIIVCHSQIHNNSGTGVFLFVSDA